MVVDFLKIFSGTRVCGAQSRNFHCMGQAGRGQAEHWLQCVPDGQAFEFIGRQIAER